jgi:hypothetical protein
VRVRIVLIANLIKEMNLLLRLEERRCDAVYWSVSPALIVEAALPIEVVKERLIGWGAPKLHVCDLEV